MTSKTKILKDGHIRLLKYGSWATSAGHADWYVVQATSPQANGDSSMLSDFLVFSVSFKAH